MTPFQLTPFQHGLSGREIEECQEPFRFLTWLPGTSHFVHWHRGQQLFFRGVTVRISFLTILCMGFLGARAWAEQPVGDKDLQVKLATLEKESWEAAKRQDSNFFKGYMADDFIAIFADGLAATKKDFVMNLADFKVTRYSMEDVRLLRINHDAAFVLYRLKYEGLVGGKPVNFDAAHASSLYVLREGKWRAVFYQETGMQKK